jgi:hypothetical protein
MLAVTNDTRRQILRTFGAALGATDSGDRGVSGTVLIAVAGSTHRW